MQWSLIRTWAKDKGYQTIREKSDSDSNPYTYYWTKVSDSSISGTTNSLSKLATIIFNNITDNAFVEYQKEYELKQLSRDINHDVVSGSW